MIFRCKITTYNLSTTGTNSYLTDDQRNSYSYEKYNEDPGLKVIYNYRGGSQIETQHRLEQEHYSGFRLAQLMRIELRWLLLPLYVR